MVATMVSVAVPVGKVDSVVVAFAFAVGFVVNDVCIVAGNKIVVVAVVALVAVSLVVVAGHGCCDGWCVCGC